MANASAGRVVTQDGSVTQTTVSMTEMTDREALMALLDRFGLTPEHNKYDDIVLMAHSGGVEGYQGFHCNWKFDENGQFRGLGVWE